MKTFKDLSWKRHPAGGVLGITQLNNHTISVVGGSFNYSSPRVDLESHEEYSSFEVAIMDSARNIVTQEFLPNSTDDVLGWQSKGDISSLMLIVQSL
jgi:hypothetical protein